MVKNTKGEKLKRIGVSGDITFYITNRGEKYQQIGSDIPFKVRNGSITYRYITKIDGYAIKYNNNGLYGFAVYKNRVCLEDRIWEYERALAMVYRLQERG